MENITFFMSQIKLFLENKSHGNHRALYLDTRMCMHAPDLRTQALCMRMHARVLETMKDKFFTLKLRFGMNPTSSDSRSKPSFFQYKKPYMVGVSSDWTSPTKQSLTDQTTLNFGPTERVDVGEWNPMTLPMPVRWHSRSWFLKPIHKSYRLIHI